MNTDNTNNKESIAGNAGNESLEDAAKLHNDIERSYLDKPADDFKAGANWQQEKDKEIRDKLVDLVKRAAFWYSNEANYPEGTNGYKFNKDAKQLLQSIKDI